MNEVLLIGGMALVTFACRYPVLALLGKVPLPEPIFRALKFIPPAVLTAIIVPEVLMPGGTVELRLTNAYLIAGVCAVFVAWRTRNLLLTIILSMAAFWVWRWLMGGVTL